MAPFSLFGKKKRKRRKRKKERERERKKVMAFIGGAGLSTRPRNRTESSWNGGGRGGGLDPAGDSFVIKASIGLGGPGALRGPHRAPGAWAHPRAEGFPPCPRPQAAPTRPLSPPLLPTEAPHVWLGGTSGVLWELGLSTNGKHMKRHLQLTPHRGLATQKAPL